MSSHIRKFESFREIKRKFDKYNEHVLQIDDKYKVGGIEVSQSLINSYVKKVKEETGKNIRQMFSDMEIAEALVKYVAVNKLEVEKIPAAALLGGEIPMDDDDSIDDTTENTADETGIVEPGQSPESIEGGEPQVVEGEEPTNDKEQDMEELPTGTEDETQEGEENYEEPSLEDEGEESEEESEENSEEETQEGEENTGEQGNEELPI